MINKLTPEQVTNLWEDIKEHLIASLPPSVSRNAKALNRILEAHIKDTVQTWTIYEQVEDRKVLYGLITTAFSNDFASDTKSLIIYGLTGYRNITEELYLNGFETMKQFAKEQGCKFIIAYSKVPRVVQVSKVLGANVDTTFIQWEV